MRAVPEQLDLAAVVGEKLAYSFFHRTQCCEVEEPTCDSALVRDDGEDVAGTSQSGGALGRTWQQDYVVWGRDVVVRRRSDVDCAVPIKKGGTLGQTTHGRSSARRALK